MNKNAKTAATETASQETAIAVPMKNSRVIDRLKEFERLNAVKSKDASVEDLFKMGHPAAKQYTNMDTGSATLPVMAIAINYVEKYHKGGNRGYRTQFETQDGKTIASFSNAVLAYVLRLFLFTGSITEEMFNGEERLPNAARLDFDAPILVGITPKTFEGEPDKDGVTTRKTYELETVGGSLTQARKLVDGKMMIAAADATADDGEVLPVADPV